MSLFVKYCCLLVPVAFARLLTRDTRDLHCNLAKILVQSDVWDERSCIVFVVAVISKMIIGAKKMFNSQRVIRVMHMRGPLLYNWHSGFDMCNVGLLERWPHWKDDNFCDDGGDEAVDIFKRPQNEAKRCSHVSVLNVKFSTLLSKPLSTYCNFANCCLKQLSRSALCFSHRKTSQAFQKVCSQVVTPVVAISISVTQHINFTFLCYQSSRSTAFTSSCLSMVFSDVHVSQELLFFCLTI